MEKIINYKGKKYKILRCASTGFAVADFRAITKQGKDLGWKPVRNLNIRKNLGNKFCKKTK